MAYSLSKSVIVGSAEIISFGSDTGVRFNRRADTTEAGELDFSVGLSVGGFEIAAVRVPSAFLASRSTLLPSWRERWRLQFDSSHL